MGQCLEIALRTRSAMVGQHYPRSEAQDSQILGGM